MENYISVIIYALIIIMFVFNSWLSILNYRNRHAEVPEEVKDVYDPEKYKEWLKYNMTTFKFSMITRTINMVVFILLLATNTFVYFSELVINISNPSLQVLLFMGMYFAVDFVIGIFTSYYYSFVIEEEFGFNKMTKKTFIMDKIKNLILTVLFGGGLIYLLFTLYSYAGNMFFVFGFISLAVIIIAINLLYVSVIVPLFNKLTPLEEGELKEGIDALAIKTGYEVGRISIMDASRRSTKLNAFFSGMGKIKKIVLYDTLVDKMENEEILAVLAHEIGHNKKKHVLYNLLQSFISIGIFLLVFILVLRPEFSTAFGFSDTHFGFAIIVFSVLISPISLIFGLFTSGLSRKFEYQADAYAAENTNPESMIMALKKLAKENFANLTPHPLLVKLTYSHPPIADRIKAIKKAH